LERTVVHPTARVIRIRVLLKAGPVRTEPRTSRVERILFPVAVDQTILSFSVRGCPLFGAQQPEFKRAGIPTLNRHTHHGANSFVQWPGWAGFLSIVPPRGMHWFGGSSAELSTALTSRSNAFCAWGSISSSCGNVCLNVSMWLPFCTS